MRVPWWVAGTATVARRPRLWPTALSQLLVLAGPGWWRRSPHLPRPEKAWLGFRMETAYGDPGSRPSPKELVAFLEWVRETRKP